nr:hypothetical protein [Tanacetum cinerariifolium]
MGQDRQMQMVGGNGGNQFRQYAGQNAGNPAGYNDVIRNQNQIGNGNLVTARAKGNTAGNQIRCYNCRGVLHYARNCTVRPRRRDAAYLQTHLLIAQKEEAGIQLQAEEYDLMAAVADLDEIVEVNAICILMANLQQASTSGTQTDSAPVYDSDGLAEVHENCDENYDDNKIFNMFTQKEHYTELLEPISESYQVPQNDNDVIFEDASMEQAIEVEKVNSVNRKLKETNADLTTELARYKNQESRGRDDCRWGWHDEGGVIGGSAVLAAMVGWRVRIKKRMVDQWMGWIWGWHGVARLPEDLAGKMRGGGGDLDTAASGRKISPEMRAAPESMEVYVRV